MGIKGWALMAAVIVLSLAALVATSVPSSAQTKGGTLRVALEADPSTLDPAHETIPSELAVFKAVFNTLVGFDRNLAIVPELAESWGWDTPKTLTMKLRKGVKFHDNTDFDAAAVKFNIDRLMDPATKSGTRAELSELDRVDVVDPLTVRFHLKYPSAAFLASMGQVGGIMLSPTAIKTMGLEIARQPVGTGPFSFVEWLKDDHVTVQRFPGYWDAGKPYLDKIVFRPVVDTNVRTIGLKTGNYDFIDKVVPKDVAGLKTTKGVVYMETPGLNYIMIRINCGRPPFDSRVVRQALANAVDREAIVKGLLFNSVQVAAGPISPASWAYSTTLKGYGYDAAKARALLRDAGHAGGIKFEMQVIPDPLYMQIGQAIKAQAAGAGMEINLVSMEVGKLMANSLNGNYQVMLSYRTGREDPDGSTFRDFYSTGAFNRMKYSNPKMDDLLVMAREKSTPEERKAVYLDVQKLVLQDSPMVFIAGMPTGQAMTAKVKNFVHYPNMTLKFTDVWLEK
jgi:peptide/nickel transport system substrate-binding protein